ncbi:MAG: PIN domain-containing protein [Planctomycetota bacterium]
MDTDVVSFLFKEDTRAEAYGSHLRGKLFVISFMTLAELLRWALTRNWGGAKRRLLDDHLRSVYVQPYDRDLCRIWAQITDEARRAGRPIQCADAWVAAVSVQLDLPLVTNNPADYAGVGGLRVLTAADTGS